MGQRPDYVMLVVPGNAGEMPPTTKEQLGIALALRVATFVVVTKVDLAAPAVLDATVRAITAAMQGDAKREVMLVKRTSDVLPAARRVQRARAHSGPDRLRVPRGALQREPVSRALSCLRCELRALQPGAPRPHRGRGGVPR